MMRNMLEFEVNFGQESAPRRLPESRPEMSGIAAFQAGYVSKILHIEIAY